MIKNNDSGIVWLIRKFYDSILGDLFDGLDNFFRFTIRAKMFVLNISVAIMSVFWHGVSDSTLYYLAYDVLLVDIIAYWLQKPLIRFQDLINDTISNNWIKREDIDPKYLKPSNPNEIRFYRPKGGPVETIVYEMLDKVLQSNKDKIESKQKAWVYSNLHTLQDSFKGIKSREVSARNGIKSILESLKLYSGAFYLVNYDEQKLKLTGSYNTDNQKLSQDYSLSNDTPIVNSFNDNCIKKYDISRTLDTTLEDIAIESIIYYPVTIDKSSIGIMVLSSHDKSKVSKILKQNSIYDQYLTLSIDSFAMHMITIDSLLRLDEIEEQKLKLFNELSQTKTELEKVGNDDNVENIIMGYMELSPIATIVLDESGNILYQNEKSIEILGDINSNNFISLLSKCQGCISGANWINSFMDYDFDEFISNEYILNINNIQQSAIVNKNNPDRIIISHKSI